MTQTNIFYKSMNFTGFGGSFDFASWNNAGQDVAPPAEVAPEKKEAETTPPVPPPADAPTDPVSPTGKKEWQCEKCFAMNFVKRNRCKTCQEPRPSSSSEDATCYGGPPGLFKKGDWQCTHCGNVNWARRDKCNICNSSKPSTNEEPRTGRGGGHFDLQDPSDRKRHDSDDEDFDEFGRRKGKPKSPQHTSRPPSQSDGFQRGVEAAKPVVMRMSYPPPPPTVIRSLGRSTQSTGLPEPGRRKLQ
eukprot:GHVO01023145.1.p1 GENE.GHVO01023145.1~~GHVO01023145.1.p1  ORF type:complete len:245 (+),score=33.21 GHVO01023145.1:54-788(+)